MNFSYAKLTTLRPQKERRLKTFLTALAVAAAFIVPYMLVTDGYFTFYGDFNVQQISFYKHCHQAIRSGNIGWDWNTDLGANFIGSYSFYLLGSPFFWLTIPFPNSFVPYLMGPLLVLKFACAALTAYLYIRRFTKTTFAAELGGLLYAFSGFSIYNIFFNHFHEAIIVFPLLLLSMELLITENRRGFFAVMVAVAAVTNYFFFFGMAVFCVIYYFVKIISGAYKFKFSRFAVLGLEAVLGVVMAAVLLVPSILAISSNSRIEEFPLGWSGIMYSREQIYLNIIECFFFPPDLPARPVFFPSADVKWSSLGGWLPVFSMVGVFVWFINKKKSWLKRVMGVCVFMALVPALNSLFYAFNRAYYARWFYMPILMMCLATVMLTEDTSVDWRGGFRWTAFITGLFALAIGLYPQINDEGNIVLGLYSYTYESEKYNRTTIFDGRITLEFNFLYFLRFWLAVFIAAAGLVVLYFLLRLMKKNARRFYRAAVVWVCIFTIVYANVFVFGGRSHSYRSKEVVVDQLIEGDVTLDGDNSQYRIDVYEGVDNTGMFLGYPTINAFHSVVPSSIASFYEYLGINRDVASRPDTDYPAIRPLLSVKYLLNSVLFTDKFSEDGENKMPAYKYVKTDGGYDVYENLNYIPYGFSYDYYMDYDFCDSYDEEARSRLMLKAMLLSDNQVEKYSGMLKDLSQLDDGSDVTLSQTDAEMAKDSKRLKKTAAEEFSVDKKGFTARVVREKANLVFFSVPYDEGWSATVNGRPVDIEQVNVGFMAVPVGRGESTIRFDYKTPGLAIGAIVTLSGVAVLGVYLLVSHFYKRRHPDSSVYPEGTQLLEQWHSLDLAEAARESLEEIDPVEENILSLLEDYEEDTSGIDGGFSIDYSAFLDE